MKTARFFFVMMIAVVLLPGTNLASQSNSVRQPTPSQSREASDSSERQKGGQVSSGKNQTGAGDSDVGQNSPERRTGHVTQRRPNQSGARPASVSHQVRSGKTPVARNLRPETLENSMGSSHRMGSTTSNGISSKTINHHSAPIPLPTSALNGQQFKSPRDPGARLASSGGPLTAARGTAVINGTNMKHKP
jgi:hypothetical protein